MRQSDNSISSTRNTKLRMINAVFGNTGTSKGANNPNPRGGEPVTKTNKHMFKPTASYYTNMINKLDKQFKQKLANES